MGGVLARGAGWRAELPKGSGKVCLCVEGDGLPRESEELRDFRIEVPLEDWARVFRLVRGDRKLLGGLLLDFARRKDRLSVVMGNYRLYRGLVGIIVEATLALVEAERLQLVLAPEPGPPG